MTKPHRARITAPGMSRFEVLGLASDRALIRTLASRLAKPGPEAANLRATVTRILDALRRSPLVGADLNLARSHDPGPKVDLFPAAPE